MTAPRVAAVIVTATGCRTHIERCLTSLRECAAPGLVRVVVADNASTDGTPEYVAQAHPEVELIPMGRNAGFAVANNRVLAGVTEPYALLINPDAALLEPGTLEALLATLDARDDAGAIGCRHVDAAGRHDHNAHRATPSPRRAALYAAGQLLRSRLLVERSGYTNAAVPDDAVAPVGAISGAFMLVRTATLRQIGCFDERYWMYGEDLDLCRRMWEAGWSVLYDGRHTIFHAKGGASGVHRSLTPNLAFHHSLGRYYRKFDARHDPLDALVYAGIGARFVVSLLAGLRR